MSENATTPRGPESNRWAGLPVCTARCRVYRIGVAIERIGLLNAILEGYEWIARIQTEDKGRGLLRIDVPEDWVELFEGVMASIADRVQLRHLNDGEN